MPISGAFFTAGDADSGPSGAALQLRRRNIYAIHRAAGKVDSNLAQSNVEGDGNEFPGHLRDWRPQARFELAFPPPESQKTTAGQTHFEWLVVASRVGPFSVLVLQICCQRATSELSEPGLPG